VQLFSLKARLTKIEKLKLERYKTRILERYKTQEKKRRIVPVKMYMLFHEYGSSEALE
jgi:hypothetical protein